MNIPQLPEIGRSYICYDDGKIRRSRAYKVVIDSITPLSKCSQEVHEMWKYSLDHLHRREFENPPILVATSYETDEPLTIYLAPAVMYSGKPFWFGLGSWFGEGELDVDGSLTEWFTKEYRQYASEEDYTEWLEEIKEMLS